MRRTDVEWEWLVEREERDRRYWKQRSTEAEAGLVAVMAHPYVPEPVYDLAEKALRRVGHVND